MKLLVNLVQPFVQSKTVLSTGLNPFLCLLCVSNRTRTFINESASWAPFRHPTSLDAAKKIQGNLVFPNLDVFAAAGANTTLVKGSDVLVQNGVLSVEFDNVVQNAKVDGIEVLPVTSGPSGPPLALNFKYPDGTPVAGTLAYAVSSSLLSFQGSAVLNNGQAQCVISRIPAPWASARNLPSTSASQIPPAISSGNSPSVWTRRK